MDRGQLGNSDASTINAGSSYTLLSVSSGSVPVMDDGLSDGDEQEEENNQPSRQDYATMSNNEEDDDEIDDPLQVAELARSFDTLMSRIHDRTTELAQQVELSVSVQRTDYEVEIDRIQDNLERVKYLVHRCDGLNQEFQKLEQISYIASDFRGRLSIVERDLSKHLQNKASQRRS